MFLVLATIGLFISGERNVSVARRSADAARDSADAAKKSAEVARATLIATNRAWLSVRVSLVDGQHALRFDKNGAALSVRIDLENVGNAPAVSVSWRAWLVFTQKPFQELEQRCRRIRESKFGAGPTIFPNTKFPKPEMPWSFGAGSSWEELDKALPRPSNGPARLIQNATLIGCVDYAFPAEPEIHHQTKFVYFIGTPFGAQVPEISEKSGNVEVPVTGLIDAELTAEAGAD